MNVFHICAPESLQVFVQGIFEGIGAPDDIAEEAARHLVRSNLSGQDSHGLVGVMRYVEQADQGELDPSARPVVLQETSATVLLDARRGIGLYSTMFALDCAMGRAMEQGAAVAAVRHSTSVGRLGEYTERAAEQGFVAIVTAGAAGPGVGSMAPYGGRDRFFGANPWSIGIPTKGGRHVVFDSSTATLAEERVQAARASGGSLPPGCIIDSEGNPATDPEMFYGGGALVPLGGLLAGQKGSGLAMAAALLGSLAMTEDPSPVLIGTGIKPGATDSRGRIGGVFIVVVDPGAFGDAQQFKSMAAEAVAAAKRVPPAAGFNEVLMPGEPERRRRERREREGIFLPQSTWDDLSKLAARFSLRMPSSRMVNEWHD